MLDGSRYPEWTCAAEHGFDKARVMWVLIGRRMYHPGEILFVVVRLEFEEVSRDHHTLPVREHQLVFHNCPTLYVSIDNRRRRLSTSKAGASLLAPVAGTKDTGTLSAPHFPVAPSSCLVVA